MNASSYFYFMFAKNILNDLFTDLADPATSIKVALLESGYTPDRINDENWVDVSVTEVTGAGYSTGGKEIINKLIESTNSRTDLKADDVNWNGLTCNAKYAVVYDNTPAADVDKKLIYCITFGEEVLLANATLNIFWDQGIVFSHIVP